MTRRGACSWLAIARTPDKTNKHEKKSIKDVALTYPSSSVARAYCDPLTWTGPNWSVECFDCL